MTDFARQMVEFQSTLAAYSTRPANVGGVVKGDMWLGSTTPVGSALRFRLMGLLWPRYSFAQWVLWVDGLCAIKNILDYFMFCQ